MEGKKSAGVGRPVRAGWMAGVRNNMLQGTSERRYKYTEGMKPCRGRVMNDEHCGWEDGKERWMRQRERMMERIQMQGHCYIGIATSLTTISFCIWNA